jgi:protein-disulfide isomerase
MLRLFVPLAVVAWFMTLLTGGAAGVLLAPKVHEALGLSSTASTPSAAAAVSVGSGTVGADNGAPESASGPTAVETAKTLDSAQAYARLGAAEAPVQIVVFEDPQCGYCRQFASGALKQLVTEYVDTGKAALTYRHLLVIGPESKTIAKGMACAGQQGKFWPFHEKVYAEDASLIHASDLLTELQGVAANLGMSKEVFATCLKEKAVEADLQKDIEIATQLRVLGTPTMFINGKPMMAVQSIEMLRATIDAELEQAAAGVKVAKP